jgi:hypothetical protein
MYLFEYKPNMLSSYYICEKEKAVLDWINIFKK